MIIEYLHEMDFRGEGMFERIAGSLLNDAVDVQTISFRKYRPVAFFGKSGQGDFA